MEKKVAQPSCPLIFPESAGSLPAVFGSLPNINSSASCRRVQAGSLRSPDEHSALSPEFCAEGCDPKAFGVDYSEL